jgi:hypothetical protein
MGNAELTLEKLIFVQIVKDISVVCGSGFIALFTRVLHTKQVGRSSNASGIEFRRAPFQCGLTPVS